MPHARNLIVMGLLSYLGSLGASQSFADAKPLKATFQLSGLHCPPCTATVEKSLKSVKGVKSCKVDWATKNAQVEFDEQLITAQEVAGKIAATPHMMGAKMHYGSSLTLRVAEIGGTGNADKAKAALAKVKGVSTVTVDTKQKSVAVAFAAQGALTTTQLVDALKTAGLEAAVIP